MVHKVTKSRTRLKRLSTHALPEVKYLRARLNPRIGAQDVAQELCFLLLHFPPLCPLAPSLPHLAPGLAESATQ